MRFLFNAQFDWPYGDTVYAAAAALRARGHEAAMVACGHLPDYCEQENLYQQRPDCSVCTHRLDSALNRFQLPRFLMSGAVTLEDMKTARRISQSEPVERLRRLVDMDVPVGHIAHLNLFQYLRGIPAGMTPRLESVYRRCVASAILVARGAHRLIDHYKPDVVVTTNGKFLQWAPFVHAARNRGLRFVTWEDINTSPVSLVLDHNHVAHEMTPWYWEEELAKPFPAEHKRWVRDYFTAWGAQKNTPFAYYDQRRTDDWDEIVNRLGLRKDAPLIALFPNLGFDSSSVNFERAFDGIFDWILRSVEYAARDPGVDLVVRVHPAEEFAIVESDEVKRTETVIAERFPNLPPNVKIARAESGVSSYALAERCAAGLVYTGTLGLEMALRGKRPWVVARAYYAGLGFSRDFHNADELWAMIGERRFDGPLSAEEVERAERLAYLTRRRMLHPIPYFELNRGLVPPSADILLPGKSPYYDRLCERYVSGEPFLDLMSWDEPAVAAGAG